jgi:hypothetical protein
MYCTLWVCTFQMQYLQICIHWPSFVCLSVGFYNLCMSWSSIYIIGLHVYLFILHVLQFYMHWRSYLCVADKTSINPFTKPLL